MSTPDSAYFQKKLLQLRKASITFDVLAFELFEFQSRKNPVYAEYLKLTGQEQIKPIELREIPFLPIGFFKTHKIICSGFETEFAFTSSGTGGQSSKHFIYDPDFYDENSLYIFERQVGELKNHEIIAPLPGYEENPGSSLIRMVRALAEASGAEARFSGLDFQSFLKALSDCRSRHKQPLIFGVSHALLELIESGLNPDLSDCVLLETGGMKGLRKEMGKFELLQILQAGLKPKTLISEFGMCELMSQAYGFPEKYQPAYSLKALVRNPEAPLEFSNNTGRGALNFIDLANYGTCCFLASEDLGEVANDGSFQVFGRLDQAEIRGCNLLFAD